MPTSLSGQIDLGAATEGVALASNTDIASFTINNSTDTASAFTATIDWGDGTTTPGTVVGSNGSFTVDGGHTYLDEGFPQATVTITHTADNAQIAPTGNVPVADRDNISVQGKTLTGNPNQPLTNVTVATFTTTNSANTAGDFAVSIDWGDGTTTPGTVTGSGGSFSVQGTHTYTANGDDVITIFVNDDAADAAFNSGTGQALIGVSFGGHVVLTAATEGQALGPGTTIATFGDSNNADTTSSFTATINWGDGTSSAGTVTGSNGTFSVLGDHTYTDEGDPLATVTITRTADNATATPQGSVVVSEADLLTPQAKTIGGQPGVLISNALVATFADVNTANVVGDFTATIDWGDGASSVGTVSGSGGTYSVTGSHTYAAAGQDTISVTLTDDDPGTGSATANSTAFIGFAAGDVLLTDATEGLALPNNTPVATFTDGNLSDTTGSFTATINWGDGATSAGTIVGSNGSFTVEGGHTYADEAAALPLVATVTRTSDSAQVVDNGSVDVAEADVLTPHGTTISGNPNQALSNVVVATFTDANTGNVAADFTATIDWGDGTTTPGTVSGSGATFSVAGTHTYASAGHDAINVTLTDDAPGTASATANSAANIGLSAQVVLSSATEHVALANNTTVATFSDGNPADTAGSFTATIAWGDGTTSAGTVSGSNGAFTVAGGHTYADEASAPLTTTITRTSDNTVATGSGTVAVAEHDALTGNGVAPISATAHQPLNNVTVATFSDTDTANVAGDFTATINWGDGTTTTGTISGGAGSFSVSGSHTYSGNAHDTITVTMADDAPGTASAMATTSVTITGGAFVKSDFNGDGMSDLVLQNAAINGNVMVDLMNGTSVTSTYTVANPHGPTWVVVGDSDFNGDGKDDFVVQNSNGAPEIWLMNGTTIASTVALPVPPSSWHIISTGDFNGDGNPDILWQNANTAQPAIWFMNGTSLVSAVGLPTPPASWRVIGAGDFNGDGKSDILWQNADGTPAIWEMNGSSIISAVALTAPPPQWHVVGTGDFNGDGKSDILWINTADNTPGIWEMNGTSLMSAVALIAPPSSWQIIGTSDVNGDGKSDILWQNTNTSQVGVWEMNGTSIMTAVAPTTPGTGWQLKNDGPIPSDQMGGGGGTMHLSMPDGANGNGAVIRGGRGQADFSAGFGAALGLLDPRAPNGQHPLVFGG
jgi:hypothetical protein